MRFARWKLAMLLLFGGSGASAQDVPPVIDRGPGRDPKDSAPIAATETVLESPAKNAFDEALSEAPPEDARFAAGYHPAFFGDLPGAFGTRPVQVNGATQYMYSPIYRRTGAVKAVDNESPRPGNRLYYSYGEFSNVNADVNPGLPPINLQRHVLGFEKTLFRGWASIGLRMPIISAQGPTEVATQQFGDVTLVCKVALWDDRARGRLLSSGLLITVPTGPVEVLTSPTSGNRHSLADTVLQPFAAYAIDLTPRLFVQGFSAVAVPTDSRAALAMFNDIGLGLWLIRNAGGIVRGLAPTMELHVNTPLNRRGIASAPIGFLDSVNVTWGGYLIFARATLGGAVGVPLSSPRTFGVEAAARCEWRY